MPFESLPTCIVHVHSSFLSFCFFIICLLSLKRKQIVQIFLSNRSSDDANVHKSFTDSLYKASSCCRTIRPNATSLMLFESDVSIERLLNGDCTLASRCCDKRNVAATAATLPQCVRHLQPSPSLQANRHVAKYFNCTHCHFVCTWAYDLSLHLRQKHGIHKKL